MRAYDECLQDIGSWQEIHQSMPPVGYGRPLANFAREKENPTITTMTS